MKANREDVVQAALIVERWCKEHFNNGGPCECPFSFSVQGYHLCIMTRGLYPVGLQLEEFLRNRGLMQYE